MKDVLLQNGKYYDTNAEYICNEGDVETLLRYYGICLLDYNGEDSLEGENDGQEEVSRD